MKQFIVIEKQELEALLSNLLKQHLTGIINSSPHQMLTKKEAAKQLQVCYNTLQKYISKGWLKVGKNGKIPRSEVYRFLNTSTAEF